MSRELGLISIGQLAKLTSASIVSLRYYEKLGILRPAYISEDSGYRYYSLEQTKQVEMICFLIELGIPLKEYGKFAEEKDNKNFLKLLEQGDKIAKEKIQAIEKGLDLLKELREQVELADAHRNSRIYERVFPEMYLYVKEMERSVDEANQIEVAMEFSKEVTGIMAKLPISERAFFRKMRCGCLLESTPRTQRFFTYIEMPKRYEGKGFKVIPAGTFYCLQNEEGEIEHVSTLFHKQLKDKESYIALEAEIFTGKQESTHPLYELRVMG